MEGRIRGRKAHRKEERGSLSLKQPNLFEKLMKIAHRWFCSQYGIQQQHFISTSIQKLYFIQQKQTKSIGSSFIKVIVVSPSLGLLLSTPQPRNQVGVLLRQVHKLVFAFLQLVRTFDQQLTQIYVFALQLSSEVDLLLSQLLVLPAEVLELVEQSVLFVGQMVYLGFVVSSEIENARLLLVVLDGEVVDHSLLGCYYFIESFGFSFKSFGNFVELLIFHQILRIPLVLYLLKLSPVGPFDAFDFFILLVDFLIELVLPVDFSIHEILLKSFVILLGPLPISLSPFFSCSLLFLKMLELYSDLIQYIFVVTLIVVGIDEFLLEALHFHFKLVNTFLQQFLLGLEVLRFFLLIADIPLHLLPKSLLNVLQPFLVLALHLPDDLLVHIDDLAERVRDGVSFLLQVGDLVNQDKTVGLVLPAFASLLLNRFQFGRLTKKDVISQFTRGISQLKESPLSILIRRQIRQSLRNFDPLLATHYQLSLRIKYYTCPSDTISCVFPAAQYLTQEYIEEGRVFDIQCEHYYIFVEMDIEDEFVEFTAQDLIHIHKVNRRGRKYETRVIGLPEIFDLKKILKFWKNNFQTNGRITKEGKEGKEKGKKDKDRDEAEENDNHKQEIIVQGDHREKIKEFLIYMGISDAENIRVHGAS